MSRDECTSGCRGIQPLTPRETHNRAGLDALCYRVGQHASFLETMLARISTVSVMDSSTSQLTRPLRRTLVARDPNDPSIALLDGWATVAEIVSFYQERLINEAYLGTALQRDSVEYLAKFVGYEPRPGVSASVFLGFAVEETSEEVPIPAGTPVKSTPTPGSSEKPQTFETSDDFVARPRWNVIRPRRSRPHGLGDGQLPELERLYFQGGGLRLGPNDLLAIQTGEDDSPIPVKVESSYEINDELQGLLTVVNIARDALSAERLIDVVEGLVDELLRQPGVVDHLSPQERKALAEPLAQIITNARVGRLRNRLVGTDQLFQDELLGFLFESGQVIIGERPNIVSESETSFRRDAVNAYSDARDAFKRAHKRAVKIIDTVADIPTASFQQLNGGIKQAIWSDACVQLLRSDDVSRPRTRKKPPVHVVLEQTKTITMPADDDVFPSVCASPLVIVGDPRRIARIRVTLAASSGAAVEVDEGDFDVDPSAPDELARAIEDRIREIKPTAVPSTGVHVLVTVEASFGGADDRYTPIAYAIQPIAPEGGTFVFPKLAREGIAVAALSAGGANAAAPFPGEFELADPLPGGSFKVRWDEPTGLVRGPGEREGTAAELQTFLRQAKFTQAIPAAPGSVYPLLFTFSQADVDVAYCVRWIVFPDAESAGAVQAELATQLEQLTTSAAAIGAVATEVDQIKAKYAALNRQAIERIGKSPEELTPDESGADDSPPTDSEEDTGEDPTMDEQTVTALLAASLSVLPADNEMRETFRLVAASEKLEADLFWANNDEGRGLREELRAALRETPLFGASTAVLVRLRHEIEQIVESEKDPPTSTNHEWADHQLDSIAASMAEAAATYNTPLTTLGIYRKKILQALHERRKSFVDRLKRVKTNSDFALRKLDNGVDTDSATTLMDQLFDAEQPGSLADRIARLDALLALETVATLTVIDARIDDLVTHLRMKMDALADLIPSLDPRQARFIKRIHSQWQYHIRGVQRSESPSGDSLQPITPDDYLSLAEDEGKDPALRSLNSRQLADLFSVDSDLRAQVRAALSGEGQEQLFDRLRRFRNGEEQGVFRPRVWVMRSRASLFGWNAAPESASVTRNPNDDDRDRVKHVLGIKQDVDDANTEPLGYQHLTIVRSDTREPELAIGRKEDEERDHRLFLDGEFTRTLDGAAILVQSDPGLTPEGYYCGSVRFFNRNQYGLKGRTTRIDLADEFPWWQISGETTPDDTGDGEASADDVEPTPEAEDETSAETDQVQSSFSQLRRTLVWCDPEELRLGERRLRDDEFESTLPQGEDTGDTLELDGFYPLIPTQANLILRGAARDRTESTSGNAMQTELLTVVSVIHKFKKTIYGDRITTTVKLSRPLTRDYWRHTVEIYANVVQATHGETVDEVLGGGDAQRSHQRFRLQRTPLTRLSAPTPSGQEAALELRVNDVLWAETQDFFETDSDSETYQLTTARDHGVRVGFGDGTRGARLPTGNDNVRSRYRAGLGQNGNVLAGRIDQLLSPPRGVQGVFNPIRASGGADPDGLEQTRTRVALTTTFLDRLVSLQDYRCFATNFAGVDKSLTRDDGGRIVITVTGQTAEPLDPDGRLIGNLRQAIGELGRRQIPVVVLPHRALLLFIDARIRVDHRYPSRIVAQRVRDRLYARFGFPQRDLAQDVLRADILSTVQQVEGVDFVDLNKLDAIESDKALDAVQIRALGRVAVPAFGKFDRPRKPDDIAGSDADNDSAYLCHLDPTAPDTLLLEVVR